MSIPSLVEGTGNNEARRVPNETNRQPPVPNLRRVLWKFGVFSSPSLPLNSTSQSLLRSYTCARCSCAPLDVSFILTLCQRLHLSSSQQRLCSLSPKVCAVNPNFTALYRLLTGLNSTSAMAEC